MHRFYKKLRTSPPSSPTPPQPIVNEPPIVDVPESYPPDLNPETVVDELEAQRAEASDLLDFIQCYEFVFLLHLMKTVLGITNELSQALQRKDQDLVNAMDLVKSCKRRFQHTRDNGWQSLLEEICVFCEKNSVSIPNMEDVFVARGRSRRGVQEFTNLHHFQNDLFYTIIDDQMGELNSRFNEVNTELLLCMACLNPSDSFSAMKIIKSTLRNRMGDEWMNDCLVTYVEREMFETISTDNIIKQFQKMKSRRICL